MYKIDEIKMLRLGQRDENLAREIQMDASDWLELYPGASIAILFRRPGESTITPMITTLIGSTLTWQINDFEVGITGVGNAEIRAVDVNGLRRKSRIIPCSIEETLLGDDETVLYTQDQVDTTLAHIGEAAQSALAAKASEDAAALSAENASGSADAAQAAQDAAESARDAAQAAQTAAEEAEAGAETAQSGAIASAQAAENARIAAQTAQASAQGSASQAAADKAAAEAAQAAAETAQHSAETAAGNAQASAGAASGSASAAAQSASDAAASAASIGQAEQHAAASAQAAAQSASQAATKATQASQSASQASASADQAASSATSAAGSATAAAGSADAAQAVLDSIPEDYTELSEDVTSLKSAIDTHNNILNFSEPSAIGFVTENSGKCIRFSTGELASNSNCCTTNFVDVSAFVSVSYRRIKSTSSAPTFGIAFYNAAQEYVSGERCVTSQTEFGYFGMQDITVPENAVYARFTVLLDTATHGNFELYGESKLQDAFDGVDEKIGVHETYINALSITDTASGPVASFPDGADGIPLKSCVVSIEPVQEGTGDPSPDNVRPITGWTGTTVQKCGGNLLDPSQVGTLNRYINKITGNEGVPTSVAEWRHTDYIRVAPGMKLFFGQINITAGAAGMAFYDSSKVYISGFSSTELANSGNVVTVPDGAAFLRHSFRIDEGYNTDWEHTVYICLDSAPHEWTSYTGTSLPISWESEAGTVYGGSLDVVSGLLTVDRAAFLLSSFTWGLIQDIQGENIFVTPIMNNIKNVNAVNLCSKYHVVQKTRNDLLTGELGFYNLVDRFNRFVIKDLQYSTVNDFVASLGDETIVCYLATPVTYQLSPHEILSLLGQNHVWADTGDTSVIYRADPKMYIQRLTGEAEDDMVANANIPSGKYFSVGNKLFLSTSAIAAGETITPGTNCTATDLASALNALLAQ